MGGSLSHSLSKTYISKGANKQYRNRNQGTYHKRTHTPQLHTYIQHTTMSKKLAAQALDALMSSNTTNSKISKSSTSSGAVSKKKSSSSKTAKKQNKNSLPVTKTGLKKIKHEIRYGHSVRRQQEEAEAKINPLGEYLSNWHR